MAKLKTAPWRAYASNCEQGAFVEENGELVLYAEKCDDCDLCIENCPNQAISKVVKE